MRELALISDVSTSTLYNLYQSKDTLILAALEDLLADINAVVAETDTSGLGRFLARVNTVAEQIVDTPGMQRPWVRCCSVQMPKTL